jgi:putative membrane protein
MKSLLIIFLSLFLITAVNAQQQKKSTARKTTIKKNTAVKKSTAVKANDNSIILSAVNSDLMEIELGGYTEKYAAEQRVKDLAAMIVRDHRRTKTELKSIAVDKNITVKDEMDASHKAKINEMEKNKGAALDKQYVDMMISDHTKNLNEFKSAQLRVQDKHLKDFLARAITLMHTHLDSAKSVQAYLKGK